MYSLSLRAAGLRTYISDKSLNAPVLQLIRNTFNPYQANSLRPYQANSLSMGNQSPKPIRVQPLDVLYIQA